MVSPSPCWWVTVELEVNWVNTLLAGDKFMATTN